jgi:hypothetical protein
MYVKDKESFVYVPKNDPNAIPLVQQMNHSNGISAYIDKSRLSDRFKNKVEKAGSLSINPDQPLSYYQPTEFIGNSVIIIDTSKLTKNQALYVVTEIQRIRKGSTWNDKFPKEQVKLAKIHLPIKNGQIDFAFMESFIAELEAERMAELEAYLLATGLSDTTLTAEEEGALEAFESVGWGRFNLEKLFGKSTRGKRLKSDDRISGDLPFVTAGETDEGISAFISNEVTVFQKNTATIDMFGSAKYRNYQYGCDDHIAVVHTEKVPKLASIFVTTAIHKSAHTGKFDYGRNFYAKDADELNIHLPVKNGKPDFGFMESLISAIQKLVIKDVVLYADRKIAATQSVIGRLTMGNMKLGRAAE